MFENFGSLKRQSSLSKLSCHLQSAHRDSQASYGIRFTHKPPSTSTLFSPGLICFPSHALPPATPTHITSNTAPDPPAPQTHTHKQQLNFVSREAILLLKNPPLEGLRLYYRYLLSVWLFSAHPWELPLMHVHSMIQSLMKPTAPGRDKTSQFRRQIDAETSVFLTHLIFY